jgi:hypothetical protein
VEDAFRVRGLQCHGYLPGNFERFADPHGGVIGSTGRSNLLGQCVALNEFHDERMDTVALLERKSLQSLDGSARPGCAPHA